MDEHKQGLKARQLHAGQKCRTFPKSWGVDYTAAGEIRFRIWAPAAERLDLRLGDEIIPMTATAEGWFELSVTKVSPERPTPSSCRTVEPSPTPPDAPLHTMCMVHRWSSIPWPIAGKTMPGQDAGGRRP